MVVADVWMVGEGVELFWCEVEEVGYEVAPLDEFDEAFTVAVDEVGGEFVFEGGVGFGAVVVFDGEEGVGVVRAFEEGEGIGVEGKVAFFAALFAGGLVFNVDFYFSLCVGACEYVFTDRSTAFFVFAPPTS